jgi:hypothetical protein
MNRSTGVVPRVIAAVVLTAGLAACGSDSGSSPATKSTAAAASSPSAIPSTPVAKSGGFTEHKACNVLTPAIARKVIGADASTGSTPQPQASTSSVSVTNCSYYSATSKKTVSLLSRSALDQSGADTNSGQFTTGLPAGAKKISGYGDAAYWSPTFGQFNILKHDNWYILSTGGLDPRTHTLADAEHYAGVIQASL